MPKPQKRLKNPVQGIIFNIYLYFISENSKFKNSNNSEYFGKVQQRISDATGISKPTIRKFLNQEEEYRKNKNTNTNNIKLGRPRKKFYLDLDDFDYAVIRRMVYNFHLIYKQVPTIRALKSKLIETMNFKGCDFTLRKILRQMGFLFKKITNNRKMLMEKDDVRLKRVKYLDLIRKYRSEGRDIVYTDETYVHTSHLTGKCWIDSTDKGVKQLISKGQRLIIVHAGSAKGFVPGALLMYKSTDKTGDYHDAMNNADYGKWLQNQLIPNLSPNSVLVVDNAAYHNKYVERPPNSNTAKPLMINWLQKYNIPHDSSLTKIQLYEIICRHKEDFVEYSIDKILHQHGHDVLRLPPYHPDFNPIENIWSQIKGHVSKRNIDMNMGTVKKLIEEKINMIGPDEWKKVCDHAIKCENEYRSQEHSMDDHIDRIVINVNESTDESDEDMSDCYSDCEMENVENIDPNV